MNRERLRQAEADFLQRYPGGFEDPGMQGIRKKHNVDRLVDFARENLRKSSFDRPGQALEAVATIVSRSSMVSRFEKPPFRNFLAALDGGEREALAEAFRQRLHGRRQQGFEVIVDMLRAHKLAKWALVSVVPFYYAPQREVFVKPTTAKGIIALLEVPELSYRPAPDWAFYRGYRDLVNAVRAEIVPTLAPNNAAVTGFLMSSMPKPT